MSSLKSNRSHGTIYENVTTIDTEVSGLQNYFEDDWLVNVYMPFFHANQHLISDYSAVSRNPNLCNYLLSREDLELNWKNISQNKGLTIDLIKSRMGNKDMWKWPLISANPGITMQDIMKHPDFPWDWEIGISDNPNLTINMLNQYPDKEWNWYYISRNPGITIEDIISNPQYNIESDYIEDSCGWQWNQVFANPFT